MRRPWLAALAVLAGACGGRARAGGPALPLHPACDGRWVDGACQPWSADVAEAVAANEAGILEDPEAALAAIDRAAAAPPFDHLTYVRMWRQRGLAHSLLAHAAADAARDDAAAAPQLLEDEAAHARAAMAAFDMLLALDPAHRLEYTLSPQTTFMFQDALAAAAARPAPDLDLDWARDLRVGDPVPVDLEVLADPKGFLARATLFVRRRGDDAWRAADVELPAAGGYKRVVLPAIDATAATALELYVRAYDAGGNEVLDWASPARPREVPLRWDPPTPWWRKWWVWAVTGTVVAGATGIVVYATQWEPSATIGGDVTVTGP
ncbi:MAG: hypothetical protein H6709_19040 [Kofleriaceae bacterium]|nr:hypothetical protein [Myxococcales bacterium]MCB9561793.1 hypothetical protein [Kofleriaceae bacterium]MCB9574186.1 hypothetical protein [Kofleriaceae bacterium]